MPRQSRVVIPGIPHHITQRGNRRQRTYFEESDYHAYIGLLAKFSRRHRIEILAYCLMPNHVHLVAIPLENDSMRKTLGNVHQHYTARINERQGWTGHLWQGRFSSFPMDEEHCLRAMNYVELNPVRAGLVEKAEDYPWSSANARIQNRRDPLVRSESISNFERPLMGGGDIYDPRSFREHERSGRPLGSPEFLSTLDRKSVV